MAFSLSKNMDAIRQARKEAGMSQWELAARIGRSQAWLSIRERGWVTAKEPEIDAMRFVLEKKRRELVAIEKEPVQVSEEVRNAR
jgi:ribosome-binding protein aMBF1 (putative translation factor)